MEFNIGLAQCAHPKQEGYRAVLDMAAHWASFAKEQDVDLLVFPESLMTRYEKEKGAFIDAAQPLSGPFCTGMNALAAQLGLWIAYTANEANPAGNPFNTLVLADAHGDVRGTYRKVHLFDTDFTRESDRMAGGSELVKPIDTPFGKIGLSICYDLRFPEVARTAALEGCELLLNPAAWVDGELKAAQWRTLLAARALENEMFVVGVSRCDEGYIGQSAVYSPSGTAIAEAGEFEELLVAHIDTAEITRARCAMPVLKHRKPSLYRLG